MEFSICTVPLLSRFVIPGFVILFFLFSAIAKEPPGDLSEELNAIRALAEKGDSTSQIRMGMAYRDGKGVTQDYEESLKWYRRAADQGSGEGLDNVGFMYLRGWGVPENAAIATAFFRASSDKRHAQGLYNLGNSYFDGKGVEQNYDSAVNAWSRAAKWGHENAAWRLAMLYASGESVPRDVEKAKMLCREISDRGHKDGALLLGELYWMEGQKEEAQKWWETAAKWGSTQAKTLQGLADWRNEDSVPGSRALVEVKHYYQGWNNCGATSVTMFADFLDVDTTPYDVKRLCPRNPIGTGTDWADLLAAGEKLGQSWELKTFSHDAEGFTDGVAFIRDRLDADQPVVIDFTIVREEGGRILRNGHTLLVVGYHAERDQYVLKNPNQPSPGLEVMSTEELEASWHSRGYSRLAKGQSARPLIVLETPKK